MDGKAALALARSPDKSAQATTSLSLLALQLPLVKQLPLQVRRLGGTAAYRLYRHAAGTEGFAACTACTAPCRS